MLDHRRDLGSAVAVGVGSLWLAKRINELVGRRKKSVGNQPGVDRL